MNEKNNMIAKVIELKQNVEVIVKKVVSNENYGFTLNFVAELEDKSLVNTTLTMEYGTEETRDKDFDKVNYAELSQIAMTLPTFKDLI